MAGYEIEMEDFDTSYKVEDVDETTSFNEGTPTIPRLGPFLPTPQIRKLNGRPVLMFLLIGPKKMWQAISINFLFYKSAMDAFRDWKKKKT